MKMTPCEILGVGDADIGTRENTMNALAGLAALVIVVVGCALLTETHTRAAQAELLESRSQSDAMPMYIHSDPGDWRG
jgi:hypothetical protein